VYCECDGRNAASLSIQPCLGKAFLQIAGEEGLEHVGDADFVGFDFEIDLRSLGQDGDGGGGGVDVSFDGSNVRFTFGIPCGNDGSNGPPGEVNQQQIDDAIRDTSANTYEESILGSDFSDPDLETLCQNLNERRCF